MSKYIPVVSQSQGTMEKRSKPDSNLRLILFEILVYAIMLWCLVAAIKAPYDISY